MTAPIVLRQTEIYDLVHKCPLQVHLTRKAGDGLEETPKAWFALGNALHSVIEATFKGEITDPKAARMRVAEELAAFFVDHHDEIVFSKKRGDSASVMEAAIDMVDTWWEEYQELYRHYDDPHPEIVLAYDHSKTVRIETQADLIAWDHGSPVIVDFKSGDSSSYGPFQLWFYWYSAVMSGKISGHARFRGWYHHLARDEIQVVEHYPGHTVMAKYIDDAVRRLRNPVPVVGYYCRFCPMAEVCPAVSTERKDGE